MSKKSSETVTISKAEYESLKQIESEFKWLKEQLLINKKKAFGSSSERLDDLYHQGISLLFNEAELIEDIDEKPAETTVKEHTRKKKPAASTSFLRTSRPTPSSMNSAKKSANAPSAAKRWRLSVRRSPSILR